ncbi:MAG: HAMP domain-containing protein [Chloroflexi bacterium]|nr:HAMP domain-containing protein [Chloroflexota bacterium]
MTQQGQPRQRQIGGGRKATLQLPEDRLLFILVYLKTYPLQEIMGELFDMEVSKVNEWIHRLLPLVRATQAVGKGDFTQRAPRWADDEIGELSDAFNAMTEGLGRAERERAEREQLRTYYLSQVITAQEEERKRISRELHDETGQALASLMVGLRNVEEAPTAEDMRRRLNDLRQITSHTLENVRELSIELRPSVLDDHGLVIALTRYVQAYGERHHVPVDFQTVGLNGERLSPPIETALYRIVQEALTNAAKYAQAQHLSVLLERRSDQISAIVEDDGRGFDTVVVLSGRRRINAWVCMACASARLCWAARSRLNRGRVAARVCL